MLYEISAPRIRLGSSGWAASANDASTLFTNPAGMMRYDRPELDAGLEPIYINLKFKPNSDTTVDGEDGTVRPWLPAASLYYIKPINSKLALGFGTLGFFGSQLHYSSDWVGRYYLTEGIIQGFSASFSAAYRVNCHLSLGAGYTPNFAFFKQKSKVNNQLDQLPDGEFILKDTTWGHGYFLGILYEFNPSSRIGLQYLSKISFNFKDKPKFKDIGPTLSQAFIDSGISISPVSITANCPQMLMFGFYHSLTACLALTGDIGWQQWSKFGKADITLAREDQLTFTSTTRYKDGWHYALGCEYQFNDNLLLSFGGAYDNSVISNSQRTFSFPVGKQYRFGTGFKWALNYCTSIDASYEFQWFGDLPTTQNRGPLAGTVSGTYKNSFASFVNLSIRKTF